MSTPTLPNQTPATTAAPDVAGTAPHALGFTDQESEIVVDALPIEGTFPAWLTGTLFRNGPARWDLHDGHVNHWLDGLAMLHRFSFGEGTVGYRNRLLRGNAGKAYEQDGKLSYSEFASDPCRTKFQRIASMFSPTLSDNGSVTIHRLGEEWLAMTETPLSVIFDPKTLDTLGVVRTGPKKGVSLPVAHVHHDASGDLLYLRVAMGPKPRYDITRRRADGEERTIASIAVTRPGYQHSFGLTPRYAIVSEVPFVVNPLRLALSGKPFISNYRWVPEQGSRFWAVDRESGEVHGPWSGPAFFTFHHINAYEEGDDLIVDLCAFDDASVVKDLELENVRAGGIVNGAVAKRFRLRRGQKEAAVEQLSDAALELPRIDERRNGLPYRVVYGVGSSTDGVFDRITKLDVQTGVRQEWLEDGHYAGEPVFVARPGGEAEDDGVVLTVVLEPERNASSLVVLDAATLEPIARARVPQHIPLGFHGAYSRTA